MILYGHVCGSGIAEKLTSVKVSIKVRHGGGSRERSWVAFSLAPSLHKACVTCVTRLAARHAAWAKSEMINDLIVG